MTRRRSFPAALVLASLIAGLWPRAVCAVELKPAAPGFVKSIVAAHQGRPTIVHFWGLTCSICMAELDEWGQFRADTSGFDLVLVNWDVRSATVERIVKKLEKTRLTDAEHWMLGDGFEERLRFETDPDWIGELPYTWLVAKNGTISKFSGKADFAVLKKWLASEPNK